MKKPKSPKPEPGWIPTRWTFKSAAVASHFDRHVREQLPWYDTVLAAIAHLGAHYIPEKGLVYDVGASTGNVGAALWPVICERNAVLRSIEPSAQMVEIAGAWGYWHKESATTFDFKPCDFIVMNLVAMFIPVSERSALIRKLRGLLRPGGALVIVDKTISAPGYVGTVLRSLTLRMKVESGVPAEEILAKELSLAGAQRPINPHIIPLGAVEFFRFGEFAGWIYERAETGLEEQVRP